MKLKRYQLDQLGKVRPVLTAREESSLIGGARDLGNDQVELNYSEMILIYGNVAYFPDYAFPNGLKQTVEEYRYSDGSNSAMENLLQDKLFYLSYSDVYGYEGALGLNNLGAGSASGASNSEGGSSYNIPFDFDQYVDSLIQHIRTALRLNPNANPQYFDSIELTIRDCYHDKERLPKYAGVLKFEIEADDDYNGCLVKLSDYDGNINNGGCFYYKEDHPIYYGGKPNKYQ